MRVEFNQGVSQECIDWLWANVGPGNLRGQAAARPWRPREENDAWFYERVFIPNPGTFRGEGRNVPTITVKDPKLATLFVLRWA